MIPMRRVAAAVAALARAGAAPLAAQYFGQNKVQYRSFDFQVIQTDHFEVYYYAAERAAALDAARMAERWYARLSRVLHHEFQGRKPIILYASQSDFQQTNAISGDIGEGTGGVTEFFKHRMVLPFTGSYAELEHVIGHERVHQFQYDVFSRGRIGAGGQTLDRGRSRECLQAGLGPLTRRPLERMAGRSPDDLPAAALRTLPRPPRRPTGADSEALGRNPPSGAGTHAGRAGHRLFQREELVLRGPVSRRCGDRARQTSARQVHLEQ